MGNVGPLSRPVWKAAWGLLALCIVGAAGAAAWGAGPGATGAAPALPPPGTTVLIPAGEFVPLYSPGIRRPEAAPEPLPVAAFRLDALPVTNGEYLQFVRTHPAWQRSRVKRIFAEAGYLGHWAGDEALASPEDAARPVTHVSWFAARAYCAAQGKALPTTLQWEYAANASATTAAGGADPAFVRMILEWYSRPNPAALAPVGRGFRDLWGVYDLHGLVWEWTLDFNTAMVSGESRADSSLDRTLYCGAAAATATSFRDYAAFMRYGYRGSLSANYTVANLGFRCAASP